MVNCYLFIWTHKFKLDRRRFIRTSLTMPSYKLIYFNSRGRAEETRLLFGAAGVKYEDCRLNGEEFEKLKAGLW